MSILSTSTGLFCIFVFLIHRFCKGFFVSNLRCAYVSLHLIFTQKSVYNDFQVKFSHTGNDGLACFRIRMRTESRIFFCQFCQSFTHLALPCFCLRLDSQLDNRFRELHRFKDNRMLLIANSIAGCRYFKSYCRCDITGINSIKLCPLIRMHLQDTSNTFFLIFRSIEYIRTGVHRTGINSEKCQLAHKRVSHNFKCQSGKRFVIG